MNALLYYWQAVRDALAAEKIQSRERRVYEEVAFLPAALEIIEKPVSPTGRKTAKVLLAALVFGIGWLALCKIDIVASAPGQILPAQGVQLIQPAATGVIREILVQDGEHVRAGQPLITLDPTISIAAVTQARNALEQSLLMAVRTRAVLDALDGKPLILTPPPDTPSDTMAIQLALARAQLADIQEGEHVQIAQHDAAEAARREATITAAKLNETLPLLDQQLAANEKLLAEGYASKLKVIEMRRQRLAAARDRDAAIETARKAAAEMEAASAQQTEGGSQARVKLLGDLAQAEDDVKLRRQELVKALQQSRLQVLKSPVDGTVAQLEVHTVGGVVEPAKTIMTVVPTRATLVADVKILNRDIGFVRVGQTVAVKLEAFPFTRYGALTGRIQRISAYAMADDKLGLVYPARVLLERPLSGRGSAIDPGAGMQVTADIHTGQRSILSYLLSPIDRAVGEAGRER